MNKFLLPVYLGGSVSWILIDALTGIAGNSYWGLVLAAVGVAVFVNDLHAQ